jgi:transposase-like protein
MKGHGTKFDRKMEEAVAALLTQRNIEDAAKQVGISSPTLLSWMKQPEFQTFYREARRTAFSQAIGRLQQGATAAATALLRTIVDPNTPASVRVGAAECVLNHALKAMEVEDVEARVAVLERSAAEQERGR